MEMWITLQIQNKRYSYQEKLKLIKFLQRKKKRGNLTAKSTIQYRGIIYQENT